MLKKRKISFLLFIAFISMFFAFHFVNAADTQAAQDLLDDVEAAIANEDSGPEEYYEVKSYTEFLSQVSDLGGVVQIQAVIDDVNTPQVDIDNLVLDLQAALDVLVLDTTYNNILSSYNAALATNTNNYTPNSVINYNAELERIESVLNDPLTSEIETLALEQEIIDARKLLVLQAEKYDLQIYNYQAIIVYYEQKSEYTSSSYQAFKEIVDGYGNYLYVNSVIADKNVSQEVVDDLTQEIIEALNLLVFHVGNTELLNLYNVLMEKDLEAYTSNSSTAYHNELDRIYQLIISEDLDQPTYYLLLNDLDTVEGLLIEKADYTELQELYDNSKDYNQSDFSISSYAYLDYALMSAYNMLNNDNANQTQVNATYDLLLDAIDELRAPNKIVYIKIDEVIDVKEYLVIGATTVNQYLIDDDSVVSVDNEGLVRGLRYGNVQLSVLFANGEIETINLKVQAKVSTTVFVLVASLPVVTGLIAYSVIFIKKDDLLRILRIIGKVFQKKKE